jgi:hypothetical protein
MSTRTTSASTTQRDGLKIADCLVKASEALAELNARTESIDNSGNLEILGFSWQHLKTLRDLLTRGTRVVDRRVAELEGGDGSRVMPTRGFEFSRNAIMEPITFFASYRACCRALCSAMKVAMAASDSTTVLLVRDLVLRLEKELWMIDSPERNRGADDIRAVALFLSC